MIVEFKRTQTGHHALQSNTRTNTKCTLGCTRFAQGTCEVQVFLHRPISLSFMWSALSSCLVLEPTIFHTFCLNHVLHEKSLQERVQERMLLPSACNSDVFVQLALTRYDTATPSVWTEGCKDTFCEIMLLLQWLQDHQHSLVSSNTCCCHNQP